MWELWRAAPRGPRPVRSWPNPPVRPSPGGGCNGEVDSGSVPPSWGGVASDHGPWSARRRLRWRSVAGPARPCRVLLVDETSIRRRHRYVTVVACGDSGKVLAMIPGRTKGSLARFFRDQGPQWCRQVEIVVSDGSRSYQAAIAQYLPAARHVLDRFHVVRWFTQGLTPVRRELQRRDPHRRPPTFEPDLFRARFTLLRRADHLTEAHQTHLDRLFRRSSPSPYRVGRPLQELYQLYRSRRPRTKPTRRSDGSPTSTPPARYPNTTKSWTPSSHGENRSWPTTPPNDGYPTDPPKGSTTSYQVLRRVAHGFTNPNNYAARGILVTLIMVGSSAGAGLTHLVTGLWCLCHDLSTWPPLGLLNRGAG